MTRYKIDHKSTQDTIGEWIHFREATVLFKCLLKSLPQVECVCVGRGSNLKERIFSQRKKFSHLKGDPFFRGAQLYKQESIQANKKSQRFCLPRL